MDYHSLYNEMLEIETKIKEVEKELHDLALKSSSIKDRVLKNVQTLPMKEESSDMLDKECVTCRLRRPLDSFQIKKASFLLDIHGDVEYYTETIGVCRSCRLIKAGL